MTASKSLRQIEILLVALPGISNATFVRSESNRVVGVIRCESIVGFDAISRCASGANVTVTFGQGESSQFRKLGPVSGLNCYVKFNGNEHERPTAYERFGFYAAILLYNESSKDDELLDELESEWNLKISQNVGQQNGAHGVAGRAAF